MFIKFNIGDGGHTSISIAAIDGGLIKKDSEKRRSQPQIILYFKDSTNRYLDGSASNIEAFKKITHECEEFIMLRTIDSMDDKKRDDSQMGYLLLKKDKIAYYQDNLVVINLDHNITYLNNHFAVAESHDEIEDILQSRTQYNPQKRMANVLHPSIPPRHLNKKVNF